MPSAADMEQAVIDVADAIGSDVSYLSPADQRRFDPVTALYGFAGGLVAGFTTTFFVEFGKGVGKELAKEAAKTMVGFVKRLFGLPEEEQKKELERVAAEVPADLDRVPAEEVETRLEICEEATTEVLVESGFPRAVAVTKARSVRQVVTRRVLRRERGQP